MIGRLFWFLIGAGVAVWALGKVRGYLQRASPEAVGQRVTATLGGLGGSTRDFVDRVRAASAEREAELRSVLEPRTSPVLPRPAPGSALERRGSGPDALGLPDQPTV